MQNADPPAWLRFISRPGVSRVMGHLVRAQPPRSAMSAVIRGFSKAWGVHLDEAEHPPEHYASFQDFFTRNLRPGLRPVDAGAVHLPSPSDGRLTAFGNLDRDVLVQVKGVEYSLDALMGDSADADPYRGGCYAVVYLAPNDYHRVHAPWNGKLTHWRYLPGALYPVNRIGLNHVPGLLARNERFIGHFDSEFGRAALIMVGATFVGHMRMSFTALAANEGQPPSGRVEVAGGRDMVRGQEFGVFEMGSTVVLVMQRPDFEAIGELGRKIRMGEAALRYSGDDGSEA